LLLAVLLVLVTFDQLPAARTLSHRVLLHGKRLMPYFLPFCLAAWGCREAEESLQGEEGRGSLVAALRELVARRCQMVCQLGAVFQLGPTTGALRCCCTALRKDFHRPSVAVLLLCAAALFCAIDWSVE
jgi:hypothetical protein